MNKCKDCKIFNYCSDEPYENDEICEEFSERKNGLNHKEDLIIQNLTECMDVFLKLEGRSIEQLDEFSILINKAKKIIYDTI